MPRRSDALVVVLESGQRLTLRHGPPPATRGECPPAIERVNKPCVFYRCDMHLAFVASPDRPGKRHPGCAVPPTLTYAVLTGAVPSCLLDVTDAHPAGLRSRDVAKILGLTTRAVELVVERALATAAERHPDEELDEPTGWGGPLAEAQIQAM